MAEIVEIASYKEAMELVARLARTKDDSKIVRWYAGDGWTAEAQYCPWRKRVVQVGINPDGMRIV